MDDPDPFDVMILLVPKYSQLTLAALVEPLRMANTVANRPLYRWQLCSADGQAVTSSSGFTLAVDADLSGGGRFDALFALASYEVTHYATPDVLAFLRSPAPASKKGAASKPPTIAPPRAALRKKANTPGVAYSVTS